MRIYWLSVVKILFALGTASLSSRFLDWRTVSISGIEHILYVLGLVLRSLMKLLLVRQLNWTCAIEELRRSICWLVLKLLVLVKASISLATTDASWACAGLQYSISKNFAIEERKIIWICTVEALIWISIRRELIDNALSVLSACQELVCITLTSLKLVWRGPSQVIDQLSTTTGTLMSLLQLLLHHILSLWIASQSIAIRGLSRSTNLSSAICRLLL